jgi:hypothetical protein
MRLYSYVVARDYGFAPNPFYGVCTLATCKPVIRNSARISDWIIGTGSKTLGLDRMLVFAMRVAEILTYDQYWRDERFAQKRPNLRGSLKQAYGDNIYHRDPETGRWVQADSHHSCPDGSPNQDNICRDTKSQNVLVATEFAYWGGTGPLIPAKFRRIGSERICCGRGHKCNFSEGFAEAFVTWIQSLNCQAYLGRPALFRT